MVGEDIKKVNISIASNPSKNTQSVSSIVKKLSMKFAPPKKELGEHSPN